MFFGDSDSIYKRHDNTDTRLMISHLYHQVNGSERDFLTTKKTLIDSLYQMETREQKSLDFDERIFTPE